MSIKKEKEKEKEKEKQRKKEEVEEEERGKEWENHTVKRERCQRKSNLKQ